MLQTNFGKQRVPYCPSGSLHLSEQKIWRLLVFAGIPRTKTSLLLGLDHVSLHFLDTLGVQYMKQPALAYDLSLFCLAMVVKWSKTRLQFQVAISPPQTRV